MKRKSSKNIQLVLITSLLASCAQTPNKENTNTPISGQRVYMRADSTAPYTDVTNNYNQEGQRSGMGGMGTAMLWYMAFRHMGGGLGYANNNIHPNSVSGTNTQKANAFNTQRGGFGKTGSSKSSAS